MNLPGRVIKFLIVSVLMFFYQNSEAQFVSKVIEYSPAPGQYTNAKYLGTPEAAQSIVGNNKGLVSLGAYGGSIVVYFESGIQNDPANPYGVDFTIYGNSTPTWSEPGIIQVMNDENGNGIPDEIWYEIAGSDHFWNSTQFAYQITYTNSGLNSASDIPWTDNQGKSGIIPENSFHQQPYYPNAQLFPNIPSGQYMLKGTKINGQIDLSNPGVVNSYRRTFGYADNNPVISFSEKLPDNPYTPEIEGSGGDAIDISWAVDQDQNRVKLDVVHFIRIATGINALAGWLGEVSTEITGIRDVEPALASGVTSSMVIQDLPPKIRVGDSIPKYAIEFDRGIMQNSGILWSISDPEIAGIQNGRLTAKKTGVFHLRATSAANPTIYAEKQLEAFSFGKAVITLPAWSLKVNDKLELTGKLTDQNGNVLTGISTSWRVDRELIAGIKLWDGKYYLEGKVAGKCWLFLESTDIKSIRDSVQLEVFPESSLKKVFISIKTGDKTIFPRRSVWVGQVDLNSRVDRAQKSYGLNDIPFVSLAHALAAALVSPASDDDWAFRDDAEGGSALYLWKVPENEDGSTVYHWGYGGSRTSASYRKTWIVLLNQQQVVSGFDRINVNNNDEILVYHIIDNGLPWELSQLTLGTDSVEVNQPVEIQLRKYSCSMDANRNISVISAEVAANQSIQVKQSDQSAISLKTDEFGKTYFTSSMSGDHVLTSGIDASVLHVEMATGVKTLPVNSLICKVFPNPFSESFRIECPFPVKYIEIHSPEGQLVFKQTGTSDLVNIAAWPSGVYVVSVHSETQVYQQKIIKK